MSYRTQTQLAIRPLGKTEAQTGQILGPSSNLAGWKGLVLLLLIILSVASALAFSVIVEAPVVVIAFAFLGFVGFLLTRLWGPREARIFLLVYCVSVLAAIAIYGIYMDRYGLPYYVGGSDDLVFETEAKDVVSSVGIWDYSAMRTTVLRPYHTAAGYVYFVSLLYRVSEPLGGFHTMLPRVVNCLALGLLAVITYRLGRCYGLKERTSLWVGLFVGLAPIMVYNSVHTFRDIITSLLTIWIVYIWCPRAERFSLQQRVLLWLQTAVMAIVVRQFRLAQAAAILAIAFAGDLISFRTLGRPFSKRGLYRILLVAISAAVILFLFRDILTWLLANLVPTHQRYVDYRLGHADGLSNVVFGSPPPLTYVLRALYGLVVPLPVLSPDLERLWLSAGTLVWYFLLPFLSLGLVDVVRDKSKFRLLVAFVLLYGGTVLVSFTNRHILQFLPYGVLIAGIGFERYRRYRVPIWLVSAWLGFGLVLVYVMLKIA